MKIKKEQEEQIVNFGVFNYNAKKIASILGADVPIIEQELNNKESQLSKLIEKGKDMSDYVIDLKLFEMAKSGDLKALDKLDSRKRFRK
jgi:alanine dehydrogenase